MEALPRIAERFPDATGAMTGSLRSAKPRPLPAIDTHVHFWDFKHDELRWAWLERDFVPLAIVASVPHVLVVNPKNMPSPDFKAFMEQVKSKPGRFNYGSAGGGTSHHLAGELFKLQTKTFITHIPYRGAGPALQDLIAGNVDMMFDGLGSSAQHIKGGRIKALMVSGNKRSPAFPDVPCAAELGLPDYNVTTWYGLWAPKGTPADVQARAIEEVRKAAATDEIKTTWSNSGAEFPNLTGPQFGAFVNSEIKKWAVVVKASGEIGRAHV